VLNLADVSILIGQENTGKLKHIFQLFDATMTSKHEWKKSAVSSTKVKTFDADHII